MDELVTWALTPILTAGVFAASPAEVLGFVSGAWCVWLTVKERVLAWPVGLVNSGSWLVLFAGSQPYTDAGLQIVYLVLGCLGWWWWVHGGTDRTELRVARTSRPAAVALAVGGVAVTGFLTWVNATFTATDVPLADAATTATSLVAQLMLCRKLLGNWLVWIVVDVAYIGLYAYKGLWLTAALMPVFIAMCIRGHVSWRRSWAAGGDDGGVDVAPAVAAGLAAS